MTYKKLPKVIIFDLDGTLIDSAPDLHAALNQLLETEGHRKLSMAEVRMLIGDGVPALVKSAFELVGNNLSEEKLVEVIKKFTLMYSKRLTELTTIFPGAQKMLNKLKKEGCSLAICTNKPYLPATKVLNQLGLKQFFDFLIGGDSLDGVKKPDPRPLLEVLKVLGSNVNEAVMVGDSKNDMGAARNANIKSIAVTFGYASQPVRELGADLLISDFDELIPGLRKIIHAEG